MNEEDKRLMNAFIPTYKGAAINEEDENILARIAAWFIYKESKATTVNAAELWRDAGKGAKKFCERQLNDAAVHAEHCKKQTEFVENAATQLAAKHLERIAELELEVKTLKEVENPAMAAAILAGEDTTGMGSIRFAVGYMLANKTSGMELCYQEAGKQINVEIKIL